MSDMFITPSTISAVSRLTFLVPSRCPRRMRKRWREYTFATRSCSGERWGEQLTRAWLERENCIVSIFPDSEEFCAHVLHDRSASMVRAKIDQGCPVCHKKTEGERT